MNFAGRKSKITSIVNYKKYLIHGLFPYVVLWHKHLGFVKPMAFNSKREFNPEKAMIRWYMIMVMKKWCRENIPKKSNSNPTNKNLIDQNWIFFEEKFRFRFENHHMAFVMEFLHKGDELKKEAETKILKILRTEDTAC